MLITMLKKIVSLIGLLSVSWLSCKSPVYRNMELTEENFFAPDYQPLAKAVRQGNLTNIDDELSRGLDVNVVGKEDMTLLMWAIVNKNKVSLAHLLKKGANPNFKDSQGTQPVGLAAGMDDIDYLRILLDNGGDPNSEDRGKKALITTVFALTKDHTYLLLDKGADINARKPDGGKATAVIILANTNQFADVVKFIARGADIRLTNEYGSNLPYAVQSATPNPGKDAYTWQLKAKQMLVERGINFPVPHPWETEATWQPIRRQWYATKDGQVWQQRMEAIGRDPAGLGDVWKTAYAQENAGLKAWMQANDIAEPK